MPTVAEFDFGGDDQYADNEYRVPDPNAGQFHSFRSPEPVDLLGESRETLLLLLGAIQITCIVTLE